MSASWKADAVLSEPARVNGVAVAVVAITLTMTVVYIAIMRAQGDSPLVWVMAVLAVAIGLALFGANARSRFAPVSLAVAGMLLLVMGVLGLFSIGVPLFVAGVMATVSGWRRAADR